MPDIQYDPDEPPPQQLEVEGVEVSFGPMGERWQHSYDGEDPSALADWLLFQPGRSISEDDRDLAIDILRQTRQFLDGADNRMDL